MHEGSRGVRLENRLKCLGLTLTYRPYLVHANSMLVGYLLGHVIRVRPETSEQKPFDINVVLPQFWYSGSKARSTNKVFTLLTQDGPKRNENQSATP